jgi:hypothetical protein
LPLVLGRPATAPWHHQNLIAAVNRLLNLNILGVSFVVAAGSWRPASADTDDRNRSGNEDDQRRNRMMTRDELLAICDRYVQGSESGEKVSRLPDPSKTIVHCFRDAEISAAEMQSLLAYVCQHEADENGWHEADRFWEDDDAVGRLENPGEGIVWETDDEPVAIRWPR